MSRRIRHTSHPSTSGPDQGHTPANPPLPVDDLKENIADMLWALEKDIKGVKKLIGILRMPSLEERPYDTICKTSLDPDLHAELNKRIEETQAGHKEIKGKLKQKINNFRDKQKELGELRNRVIAAAVEGDKGILDELRNRVGEEIRRAFPEGAAVRDR